MTKEKFKQLWDNIVTPAIQEFLQKNTNYELECGTAKFGALKDSVETNYNNLRPYFKEEYMRKHNSKIYSDAEIEDDYIRADRHKVAALLYLALTCNTQTPFVRLKPMRDKNKAFDLVACHEIAYDVSLNCIESFIASAQKQNASNPDPHKANFLNNGAFKKIPPLICERYASYKDSLIPRMVWATEEASKQFEGDTAPLLREMRVATNANMLANIFYFLELYSAS